MKKTVVNVAILIAVFAVAWFAKGQFSPTVIDQTTVDTVKVDVPYEVTKIKEVEKPVTVTEYRTDTVKVTSTEVVKDTVFINTDYNSFAYDARYLVNYPSAPKFLGLQFANDELELTYQTTDGNVRGKTWNAPQGYRVGLNNGQPNIETFEEPKDRFNHYIEAGYIKNSLYWSPYLLYSAEYLILGIDVKGTVNINQRPFGMVGLKYEL